MDTEYREKIKDKKRIVVKVGTSSLIHKETGGLDLIKVEHLVRELSDLHNQGKDVILVTSGRHRQWEEKPRALQKSPDSIPRAGLRGYRSGRDCDDLSEVLRRV